MEGLGINPWILLAQIVNFVFLVIVLRMVAYEPIKKMLNERQERAQKSLEDAQAAQEALATADARREEILAQARAEGQQIVAEANRRAKEEVEKLLAQARQEAERIRAEAGQNAIVERDRLLSEMRGQIAALAIAAAQKIVGAALDEQRQQALVESFFSGVSDGKIKVLPEGVKVGPAGAPVTVTSALPLTEEQQATIKRDLEARIGGVGEIAFQVDPQILGGLVLRIGDRLVDGSVTGQLERLHQSLT